MFAGVRALRWDAAGGAEQRLLHQQLVLRRAVRAPLATQDGKEGDQLTLVHLLAGDGRELQDMLAGRVIRRRLQERQADRLAGIERLGDGGAARAVDLEAAGL